MIQHPFVNPKADGGDATIARPSDWNAKHVALRTLAADLVLPANSSTLVVGDFELGSGFALELAADAAMEIT